MKQRLCDFIISVIAKVRSGSNFLPQIVLLISVFCYAFGMGAPAFDFTSKLGLTTSRTMIRGIVIMVLNSYMKTVREQMRQSSEDASQIPLIIADNYNFLQWKDYLVKMHSVYSVIVKSFSLLFKSFKKPAHIHFRSGPPPMPNVDADSINNLHDILLYGRFNDLDSIWPDNNSSGWIDSSSVSLNYYWNPPSLNARSSSRYDMTIQFFYGICCKTLGLDQKEGVVCIDPEPQARLLEDVIVMGGQDGKCRNFIVPPAPFHMEEHVLSSLFRDYSVFMLLFVPLLCELGYRPKTYSALLEKLVSRIETHYGILHKKTEDVFIREEEKLLNVGLIRLFQALSVLLRDVKEFKHELYESEKLAEGEEGRATSQQPDSKEGNTEEESFESPPPQSLITGSSGSGGRSRRAEKKEDHKEPPSKRTPPPKHKEFI